MARTAQDWIDLVLDPGWTECDQGLAAADPLGFPGYSDRDPKRESVITADGAVAGLEIVAISFEFDVFGGSMASPPARRSPARWSERSTGMPR